jgi:hypothetical protein
MDIRPDAARSMMNFPIYMEVSRLDPVQVIIPTIGTACSGCYPGDPDQTGRAHASAQDTPSMLCQVVRCSYQYAAHELDTTYLPPPDRLWRRSRKTLGSTFTRVRAARCA